MIAISAHQLARLQQESERSFAQAEAQHLAAYDPPLAAAAGPAGLEAAGRLGIAAARRCGWSEGPQVRLYLELMTSFGSHFDSDPLYAWLRPLLDPASEIPARERSRLLWWHAGRYLARAHGRNGVHLVAAGQRAARLTLPALADLGAQFHDNAPALLLRLHPQRIEFVSVDAARALVDQSPGEARRLQLGGPAAAPLLLCLMFGFGHRVADDPLHPWVREALQAASDPEARTAALHAAAQAQLARLLQAATEASR